MKPSKRFWFALILTSVALVAAGHAQSVTVPLSPDRWTIGEKNERAAPGQDLSTNGKVVDHLGQPSLHLAKGFAYVRDLDLQNGTIDADMAFDPKGSFIGLAFRVQSEDNYELFFFRKGAAGSDQAIQYTPGFLGANAWQIYNVPQYAGTGDFPYDQWFHVRVVVAGMVAKLYLNHAAEPALVVPDLKQGYSKGSIGFWGQAGGGYFANVTYTPDNATYACDPKPSFLPGTLTDWELSQMFDAGENDPAVYPDVRKLQWEKVQAESPGMVVIQRYRRDPNIIPPEYGAKAERVPGSKFVFARTTIHADRDELRKMNLGYSDQVVVYLNSKPIYSGNNAYHSREPDYLGLLNADSDVVYLPLKKGDNELVLAVTEFFGGWGYMCRLGQ
ncbi:MAG: hypothetical protein WA655_20900 [Candidatus Korobacteraceae bacterium]